MTVREPTSSLSPFRGLRGPDDTSRRRFDAEWFATACVLVGAGLGSILGVVVIAAGVLVFHTSMIGGVAPSTVQHGLLLGTAAVAAAGVLLGVLALWRSHVEGAGVRGRATAGLVVSTLVGLLVVVAGLLDSDEARWTDDQVSRPGWAPFADLRPGDCVARPPETTYDSVGDRAYVVPCSLTHRAEVVGIGRFEEAVASPAVAARRAEARCAAVIDDAALRLLTTDDPVAVHATVEGQRRGLRAVVCLVVHDTFRTGSVIEAAREG